MSRRAPKFTARSAASVFAALGDDTRLSLLSCLCDGQPRSVSQLTQGTKLSRQGVTKHLTILERANVVARQRVGRESRYSVRPEALNEAKDFLGRASQQWDEAMARLKQLVED
jgi:DNA-binding transcriptional ArsR family regulator